MARKRTGHVTPRKGLRSQRNNKTRISSIVTRLSRKRAIFTRRGEELQSRGVTLKGFPPNIRRDTTGRVLGALSDMRDKGPSFSEAAHRWHLDTRTLRKYARSGLRTLKSGRIKSTATDRIHYTFLKPTTKPGEYIPVETKSLAERQLYVQWRIALESAKRGDYSLIDAFPKGTLLNGVRLPTGHVEIQRILDALAEEGSKFEGPYRIHTGGGA